MNGFQQSLLKAQTDNFIGLHGQSNAYGVKPYTEIPSDLNVIIPKNKIWNITTQSWETLQLNVNNGGMPGFVSSSAFGIEMRLMKLMHDYYKGVQYLHKYTYFGTYLAQVSGGNPDWNINSSNELYDNSNTDYLLAKGELPTNLKLKCIVWIQGEQDTDNSIHYSVYQTNLINFIAGKRALYNLPNLPFLIVRLGNLQTGLDSTGKSAIRSAQETVALMPNNYLISADGITTNSSDHIHYDPDGSYDELALRVFNQIIAL